MLDDLEKTVCCITNSKEIYIFIHVYICATASENQNLTFNILQNW